ncbi:MAG: sugar phosphate isomerase/epimerase family protein [Planctomycetota bacterium]
MPRISVQLYTLRQAMQHDAAATLAQLSEIGFRFVEPAGYAGLDAQTFAELLRTHDLSAPSCHGPLPIGDHKHEIIERALTIGHRFLMTGVPPQGREHFSGADRVRAMAELYCEAADNVAAHGIQVGYHNHDWDLAKVDGISAYRLFLDNTPDSVLMEADLYWVARAGLDPVAFIKDIGARGRCLHFKDGLLDRNQARECDTADGCVRIAPEDPPFVPAGRGDMDLRACAAACTAATEFVVVELDAYQGDMLAAVAESHQYLNGLFA